MKGITKEKSAEQAIPFFTRIYKNHKTMIEDILENTGAKSSAEVVRRSIEIAHANFTKNKKLISIINIKEIEDMEKVATISFHKSEIKRLQKIKK